MRMRHAGVMAGLALGLMQGVAKAATLEYNVLVPFNDGNAITGTIDTDYKPGSLSSSDITNFDLFYAGAEFTASDSRLGLSGTSLIAVGNSLYFSFDNSNSEFSVTKAKLGAIDFYSGGNSNPYYEGFTFSGSFSKANVPVGTVLTIGMSEGSVSLVPLPASAPLFGAAILALGAIGYGVKRKGKATA